MCSSLYSINFLSNKQMNKCVQLKNKNKTMPLPTGQKGKFVMRFWDVDPYPWFSANMPGLTDRRAEEYEQRFVDGELINQWDMTFYCRNTKGEVVASIYLSDPSYSYSFLESTNHIFKAPFPDPVDADVA